MALGDALLLDDCKATCDKGTHDCNLIIVFDEGVLREETRKRYPACSRIDYRSPKMAKTAFQALTSRHGLRLSVKAFKDLEYEVERDDGMDAIAYRIPVERQTLCCQGIDLPRSNSKLFSLGAIRNFALSVATPGSKAKALEAFATGKGKLVLQDSRQGCPRKPKGGYRLSQIKSQLPPLPEEGSKKRTKRAKVAVPRKNTGGEGFLKMLAQLPPLPYGAKKTNRISEVIAQLPPLPYGATKAKPRRTAAKKAKHYAPKRLGLADETQAKPSVVKTPGSTKRKKHLSPLRELSTLAGWWLASPKHQREYRKDPLTPEGFLELLRQAGITCECDSLDEIKADLATWSDFSAAQRNAIKRNIDGGRILREQYGHALFSNPNRNMSLEWTGCAAQSDLPDDFRIGGVPISYKNWSRILENMAFCNFMGHLTGTDAEQCGGRGTHAFLAYAPDEYDAVYQVILRRIPSYLDEHSGVFEPCDSKGDPCRTRMFRDADGSIMLERREDTGKIAERERLPESVKDLFENTTLQLRKSLIAPIARDVKTHPEYAEDYADANRRLANKVSKGICEHASQTPPQADLARLLNCRETPYYYAHLDKDGTMSCTNVPTIKDCKKLRLVSVEPVVSKAQAKIRTVIEIAGTNQRVTLITEIRYSHGPFGGVPECKHSCLSVHELVSFYQALAANPCESPVAVAA